MSDSEPSDLDEGSEPDSELQTGTEIPDAPVHVDGSADLEDVVGRYDVVLVDFYADWCGPCEMLEPILEEVAAETDAVVAKVDVDELQELARQHGIRSVPTLQLYVEGEQEDQLVGVQNKATLVDLVERGD